jgi:hypothetical protein
LNISTLRLASLVLGTSLLMTWPLPSSAVPEEVSPPQVQAVQGAMNSASSVPDALQAASLNEAVNAYFKELSAQTDFASWKQATWTSYPLGPGSHGWVVLVKQNGQEIGYMVIQADADQAYHLVEYGSGAYPLFGSYMLYQGLVQLELIDSSYSLERLYTNPLQAVWKVTVTGTSKVHYLDAKTGEALPIKEADIPSSTPDREMNTFTKSDSVHKIIETSTTDEFDPYAKLTWASEHNRQVPPSFEELKAALQQKEQLTFAGELYAGQVILPLAVTGYQEWSDESRYVRVHQDDERFLPFEVLKESGVFFP